MKMIYVSYSFIQREKFRDLHLKLKQFLKDNYDVDAYAFVFDFKGEVDDKTLMAEALKKVEEAEAIFVELSNKSVGVGIEAGYAKAKGKPIIYLHQKATELKQTMNGIADSVITYENIDDLIEQLNQLELLQS